MLHEVTSMQAGNFMQISIFVYFGGASWHYKTNNIYSSFKDAYPLCTKYRCILITGVFRFLQTTVACDIIMRNFPLNIVHNAFFSLHQRNKAERSFLKVSDLLLVCVVLNHDADSSLYHKK